MEKLKYKEASAKVNALLKDYIELELGETFNKDGFIHCINPEHEDNNPSMALYTSKEAGSQRVKCFSCDANYNIYDAVGIKHNIPLTDDTFPQRAQIAYKYFGIETENRNYDETERNTQNIHSDYTHNSYTQETQDLDFSEYYQRVQPRIIETDYPQKRGFSEQTIQRAGLGYDPNYINSRGESWQALIIPIDNHKYVARNLDPEAPKGQRYEKKGGNGIYPNSALTIKNAPVFIVEGELDALSIIEAGGLAVSLGSTSMTGHFLRELDDNPDIARGNTFIIALDNDAVGEQTGASLLDKLKNKGFLAYKINPYGEYKDANESLLEDKRGLSETINVLSSSESLTEVEQQQKAEAYRENNNVASHLQQFIDGIADSVDTPYFSTGYEELDNVLDGGLYEGLYVIGAISSLGKTTLALQIADNIAESGHDVLIFSLEMARSELMAKSISRHTALEIFDSGGDMRNAKTARGITTGKRYEGYNQTELQLINKAVETYGATAKNLYIYEGVGNIGALQIRETVQAHIDATGNIPIVLIDYLQILAPYNERMTDKQNTDKAVLELKRISRDFKIPIMAISSFNRESYTKPVTMASFKESGAVEYSSDVLIGMELKGASAKDFDVQTAKKKNPREITLKILKNRNGGLGEPIHYNFYPLFNLFTEQGIERD